MVKHNYPGKFIVIEGLDGSGKSSQLALLVDFLKKKGKDLVVTKEPTPHSAAGQKIGQFFRKEIDLHPSDLQVLFAKDREEHVDRLVVPGLNEGKMVICDRYFFSSIAYGASEGLDWNWLMELNKDFLRPDIVIIINVSAETSMQRIAKRGEQTTYFEKLEKLKKVAEGYQKFSGIFEHVMMVDGEQPIEKVFEDIKKIVTNLF